MQPYIASSPYLVPSHTTLSLLTLPCPFSHCLCPSSHCLSQHYPVPSSSGHVQHYPAVRLLVLAYLQPPCPTMTFISFSYSLAQPSLAMPLLAPRCPTLLSPHRSRCSTMPCHCSPSLALLCSSSICFALRCPYFPHLELRYPTLSCHSSPCLAFSRPAFSLIALLLTALSSAALSGFLLFKLCNIR